MKEHKRELAAMRYLTALDNQDFDELMAVLAEAEQDAQLETIILDLQATWASENDAQVHTTDEPLIIVPHSAIMVSDVATQMGHITSIPSGLRSQVGRVIGQLATIMEPLPESVNEQTVRTLFTRWGINVHRSVRKLFQETAQMLELNQQASQTRLFATRKQREDEQDSEQ